MGERQIQACLHHRRGQKEGRSRRRQGGQRGAEPDACRVPALTVRRRQSGRTWSGCRDASAAESRTKACCRSRACTGESVSACLYRRTAQVRNFTFYAESLRSSLRKLRLFITWGSTRCFGISSRGLPQLRSANHHLEGLCGTDVNLTRFFDEEAWQGRTATKP